MAAGGGGGAAAESSRSLQETPTWALATVCFLFIFMGLFVEHLIHLFGHWLKKHKKTGLSEAMEKLKSVLMLLGILSLLLAVTQGLISKICIPIRLTNSMLPCHRVRITKTTKAVGSYEEFTSDHGRLLAAESSDDYCGSKGMISLISAEGVNQLNIFMCVLAVMQIIYTVATMALGRAKMRRWKVWEKETTTIEYLAENDPERFRFTRQTTFSRRHTPCTTTPLQLWVKCFFRQFFHSVAKVDYLTLRHGFVMAHLPKNSTFNFQKYIERSLEDDFKVVVGISPLMWLMLVLFMLFDVHGWHFYLWVSFIPLITMLVVGTKLEVIVVKMALELSNQNHVTKGSPLVQPNDNHFWFGRPNFILILVHYVLFMNAFEISFFIWVTIQFGFHSCYHDHLETIIIRVVLAVLVQVLCSYITLPLYALVTQMGTHFKSAVLEDETRHVIKKWLAEVKRKRKKQSSPRGKSPLSPSSNKADSIADSSSHRRNPTFSDFTSSRTAYEEEIIGTSGEIVADNGAVASNDDEIRIEVSEITSSRRL